MRIQPAGSLTWFWKTTSCTCSQSSMSSGQPISSSTALGSEGLADRRGGGRRSSGCRGTKVSLGSRRLDSSLPLGSTKPSSSSWTYAPPRPPPVEALLLLTPWAGSGALLPRGGTARAGGRTVRGPPPMLPEEANAPLHGGLRSRASLIPCAAMADEMVPRAGFAGGGAPMEGQARRRSGIDGTCSSGLCLLGRSAAGPGLLASLAHLSSRSLSKDLPESRPPLRSLSSASSRPRFRPELSPQLLLSLPRLSELPRP
mmetsp:Transcript_19392/g.54711  ORF Transcript_19392/g.54711 Transcript_19392/m.54711 type:complete len:257 (-) Transcript_19392:1024-1794(-)